MNKSRWAWFEQLGQDLRYGCRVLARNPGFSLVAILSLAIGIGANCAVFSFTDTLLLRPLTVPRPSEVVTVGLTDAYRDTLVASYRDYVDIRDRAKSFEGLVGFTTAVVALATDPAASPRLHIGMVTSANLFAVMQVNPQFGRAFSLEEDQVPGRDAVLVLGHDFWEREFHADPSVLGRTVRLNRTEFTIVGVAPRHFTGLDQYTRFEFFVPLMMWPTLIGNRSEQPLEARDFRNLVIKVRIPTELPILATFEMDRRALVVSVAAAVISVVLFALAPAFRSTRAGLTTVMKTTDAIGGGRRRWSIEGRGWLVVMQVAISVTLLVVATFMFRGFQQRLAIGPGFRTDRLLMMTFDPSVLGYTEAQAQMFFEQASDRARLVPGVRSAALTSYMPMDGSSPSVTIVPEGFQFPAGTTSAAHSMSSVDAHYFETFGIPIVSSRGFRETDSAGRVHLPTLQTALARDDVSRRRNGY